MSDVDEKKNLLSDNEGSESEESNNQQNGVATNPKPQGQRTMQRARQDRSMPPPGQQQNYDAQQMVPAQDSRLTGNMGGRTGAIRESRIKDRPQPKESRDSSLKIKIELDLEVEVDLYARVKGDVTIGLM